MQLTNNNQKTDNKTMYCVGYRRVSSDEQVKGFSLDSQKEIIEETAKKTGYKLIKIFTDAGESAKTTNRPALLEMMKYCQENKGKISRVFVYKFDRLARNTIDHLEIKAKLITCGTNIVSITESTDDTPAGVLTETLLASIAEFENSTRRDRTIAGMKKRLESGFPINKAPLGYIAKDKKITIDKDKFALLKSAWQEMATGNYTLTSIAKWLSKRGLPMTTKQASKTFRYKFYIGLIECRFGSFPGSHLPMISEDTFYKVQTILSGKAPKHLKGDDNDFPLKGIVKSSERYMTAGWSKGRQKKYAYYVDQKTRKSIGQEKMHEWFYDQLTQIQPKPEITKLFLEILKERYERRLSIAVIGQKTIEKQRLRIEAKKKRLNQAYLKGLYNDDEFADLKRELENENLINKIDKHERQIDQINIETLTTFMEKLLNNLGNAWLELDTKGKKIISGSIFPNGLDFENEAYRTATLSPAFQVIRALSTSNSPMVTLKGVNIEPILSHFNNLMAQFADQQPLYLFSN